MQAGGKAMSNQLRIGEVATLLGVTTKTLRHYHRVGLLAEPARSSGGYRLYGAADLMRLLRIRRLQALGLSLAQVKAVLGAAEQDRPLRQVLEALLRTYAEQLRALEARRARIQALLDRPVDDAALDQPVDTPAILTWAHERLGQEPTAASADAWEQDVRLFGLLEGFNWPESYQARMRQAVDQLAAHPEAYTLLLRAGEALASLAALPEDSPEVVRLADEFIRSGLAHALLRGQVPVPAAPDDPYGAVFGDVLLGALAPAQRRFLALVRARMSEAEAPPTA